MLCKNEMYLGRQERDVEAADSQSHCTTVDIPVDAGSVHQDITQERFGRAQLQLEMLVWEVGGLA